MSVIFPRSSPLRHADYSLSDEQQALRNVFESFFERECPAARVRQAEPVGFDEELWQQLVDLRVVAMSVPEELGGDGAGNIELVILAEQWGRHLAPVPLVDTVAAVRLLARLNTSASTSVLEDAICGKRTLTVAQQPATAGRLQLVSSGAIADMVLGLVDGAVVLAAVEQRPQHVENQGRTPLAWWDVAGDGVERTVLAEGPDAARAFNEAIREWRLQMAGALVGMADAALAIAVQHAKDRVAFGVPIGSFQAVAHPLVDVAMAGEVARRITWKAAWWADAESEAERHLVPMAYLSAEEAAVQAATTAVHTLGGVGFTVESDAQLYFRRAKGWTLVAGDPLFMLDQIAGDLLGPPGGAPSEEVSR